MSTNVSLNGVTYAIPATGESAWGAAVTAYLVAQSTGLLQKAGGAFTLTADADFGANFGLKAAYYKSRGTVASAGQVRLGAGESIKWRNSGNTDDLALATATDWLQFAGVDIVNLSRTQTLTNKTLTSALLTGSLDVAAAGNFTAFGSVGANNLTLGGASSTVVIPGNLQVDGTTTSVNSTNLEVTDKNININNGGNDASSEGAGLTVERTGTAGSFIYKDASATKFALGALGSEDDVVGKTATQTLTNKTLGSTNTLTGATVASFTVSGNTVTLPAATDTLVGKATTDILSNKTLAAPVVTTSAMFNAQAEARFGDSDSSNYIGLKAPATVAANKVFILPDADGSAGQVLKTDGSLGLGWVSPLTNPMDAIGQIIYGAASGTATKLAAGVVGQKLRSTGGAAPTWAFQETTSAKSADYTVTDTDGISTILMTTSSTDRTVTLPTAADNVGREITIKKVDSGTGNVIVDGEGSETIDGETSVNLALQYESVTVVCDGTSWHMPVHFNSYKNVAPTITGAGTSPSGYLYATRIGRVVTVSFTIVSGASGSPGSSMSISASQLPAWARPTTNTIAIGKDIVGGTDSIHFGEVKSDGECAVYRRQVVNAADAIINTNFANSSTQTVTTSYIKH